MNAPTMTAALRAEAAVEPDIAHSAPVSYTHLTLPTIA